MTNIKERKQRKYFIFFTDSLIFLSTVYGQQSTVAYRMGSCYG